MDELIRIDSLALYKRAITIWGESMQQDIAIEECSELIKAICKYKRSGLLGNVREEIADVMIMMEQLSIMFGEREVLNSKEFKLQRLKDRINEQEKT